MGSTLQALRKRLLSGARSFSLCAIVRTNLVRERSPALKLVSASEDTAKC